MSGFPNKVHLGRLSASGSIIETTRHAQCRIKAQILKLPCLHAAGEIVFLA